MSNYIHIGEKTRPAFVAGERLGTNGSASALIELFAVGYAASRMPDANRARRSVMIMPGAAEAHKGETIPWGCFNAKEAAAIVRLKADGCFWGGFEIKSAGSGFFSHEPKCPIYKGVMTAILINELLEELVVSGSKLKLIADAWDATLPYLGESPAIELLTLMRNFAKDADRQSSTLWIS